MSGTDQEFGVRAGTTHSGPGQCPGRDCSDILDSSTAARARGLWAGHNAEYGSAMKASEWLAIGPARQQVRTEDGVLGRAVEVVPAPGRPEPLLRVARLFGSDVYVPLGLVHLAGREVILLRGTRRDVERASVPSPSDN